VYKRDRTPANEIDIWVNVLRVCVTAVDVLVPHLGLSSKFAWYLSRREEVGKIRGHSDMTETSVIQM
jgi:hypothetical protein